MRALSICIFLLFAIAATNVCFAADIADGDCGELGNAYGPFDYLNPEHRAKHLSIVEQHHFNSNVQGLIRGQEGSIGGDLDYVLRAWPNHHRALDLMGRLSVKEKRAKPVGANYSAECYYIRALRFRPEDGMVRLMYAVHMVRVGRLEVASKLVIGAEQFPMDSPNYYYNLGLVKFDLKDFVGARNSAVKAYELGFPLPGLREKLKRAGHWPAALPGSAEKSGIGKPAQTATDDASRDALPPK